MYINRIILRDLRNFEAWDHTLQNDWTGGPLKSVLLTGPNGTGKTTILRVVAALWENFAGWLRLRKTLNADQQAQAGLLTNAGLAAIEIHGLQAFPIWLFMASSPERWEELQQLAGNNQARFVGEIRGRRGRPPFEPGENVHWLIDINHRKERLELGDQTGLPNLLFLEAETRTISTPRRGNAADVFPEPLYQWLVTYEARDRWEGHIESMLRNLKIRNPTLFKETVRHISTFFGKEKRITDFDENLRLQIQIGSRKRNSHYIDDLSAGERQCLLLMFMVSRWLMDGGIVLIDEPDLHLHVSLQRQFIHDLERVVQGKNGQLLVTSHSPTLWEEYTPHQRLELRSQIQPAQG